MSEIDLKLDQSRGMRAAELLNDDILKDALDAIEAEVVQQWEACPARDSEGKEALWQLFKTSKKFRNILSGYIETGKLATENMRAFEEKKRLRDRFRLAS